MRTNRVLVLGGLLTGLVAMVGCGSDSTPVNAAAAQSRNLGNKICDCWETFGFDSKDSCQSQFRITSDAKQCANDAYNEYPMELGPFFECFEMAGRDANNCVSGLSCEATSEWQSCLDDYETQINGCPEPSSEAQAALNECGEVVEDDMSM
jgi:hypothetical protein